jgi:hypothetical protein
MPCDEARRSPVYMGCPSVSLHFSVGAYGKPALWAQSPEFNLSHSASVAVFAASSICVGIDCERVSHGLDFRALLRLFHIRGEEADNEGARQPGMGVVHGKAKVCDTMAGKIALFVEQGFDGISMLNW